jgi:hypothetical protein
MRHAHLSTLTFDLEGAVMLTLLPDTERGEVSRRMNRVATLDGGAVVNDSGHSYADRTVTLRFAADEPVVFAAVERLVRLYGRLRLTDDDGVFLVAPQRLKPAIDAHELTLLVLERLDV